MALTENYFGLHTVDWYAPLGPLAGMSGFGGLGDYREGVCAEGADFICGVRNGLYACRPCGYPQLAAFENFQTQVNRIIKSRGLPSRLILAIDGRIGSKTTASFGKVVEALGVSGLPPDLQPAAIAAMNAPNAEQTFKEIAKVGPGAADYLQARADAEGAPKNVPAPPAKPEPITTGPATPVITTTSVPSAPRRRSRAGYVVGGLAVLAAVGVVGAAAYQKRKR
jgi:hypothetical protein